jgi:hypothetical protein
MTPYKFSLGSPFGCGPHAGAGLIVDHFATECGRGYDRRASFTVIEKRFDRIQSGVIADVSSSAGDSPANYQDAVRIEQKCLSAGSRANLLGEQSIYVLS